MVRLLLKIAMLCVFCVSTALLIGCDDEKKTVCCECNCFINDAVGDICEEPVCYRIEILSGENLNCGNECTSYCEYNEEFDGWNLNSAKKVECREEN